MYVESASKWNHSHNDHLALNTHAPMITTTYETKFEYKFQNFFHPFVGELIEKLNKKSLPGLMDPVFLEELDTSKAEDKEKPNTFFKLFKDYIKIEDKSLLIEGRPKEIDVSVGGPYANYNWELFFHVPLTIAVHLSKNQRFAEAQRWFHYIFDPTCNDTSIEQPELRFWKFLAFRKGKGTTRIDELLALLSRSDPSEEVQHILDGYNTILDNPFQPHRVARTRHVAFQYSVVMKYLDNLIAWGDSLFRQDTVESINEAMQIYVLAANVLGPRPQRIPLMDKPRPKTFKDIRDHLDKTRNVWVELEGKFPLNYGLPQTKGKDTSAAGPLFGIGNTLYFCIPRNDKLLSYWDIVANRLFKIRHCMNIEGVVRQLALFDPPLDPGMLVKAAAAGIDIGSIISGLNQPVGPVRSLFYIQKALELCNEVRSLGNSLLSAIEKGDSERMALLRQAHEVEIQKMQREVRFMQWKQAQESTELLVRGRASALERYHYYQRLLGRVPDTEVVPDTISIDRTQILSEEHFDEAYETLVGKYDKDIPAEKYPKLTFAEMSPENESGASGKGNLYLNTNEGAELNDHLPTARDTGLEASIVETVSSAVVFIPDAKGNLHFWGLGGTIDIRVGTAITKSLEIAARILRTMSQWHHDQANIASRTASYERRADEWLLQSNLAARELMHIGRQIIGSLIAEQVAHFEYEIIKEQIENSEEVNNFLSEKFTNEELYAWMQGEISRLYYEYYRFAFDIARKAERTMKQELMRPEVDATDYIKFNYWDAGRKGLLSGEALYLDVKRMETAYHENNKREYELTKHVSLRQLNPVALLALKATGSCEVTLPEWLFDLDGPGHYMRRIKNISLSIPSVTGPYTSVSCTLSLLKSSLRKSPELKDGEYARQGSEDDRFIDYFGTVQSIVTSSGNNDSGLFETNLRDERFLPFEGAGADSTWKLELPASFRQFDYNTISDVIIHVRYTARQGGALLSEKAVAQLEELVGEANASGLGLLFSLAHDFPGEWHKFVNGTEDHFTATVKRDYFPYFTQGKEIKVDEIKLFAIQGEALEPTTPKGLVLETMSQELNDEGTLKLSLSPDSTVLVPEQEANIFVLIKYSLEAA